MKILRIVISLLFVASVAFFVYFKLNINKDATVPVISCKETSLTISVKDGEDKLVKYVTAYDAKDGDLSDRIFIENMTPYISSGRTDITYVVCDSDNHIGRLTVPAYYKDYHSPHFVIKRPLLVPLKMRGFTFDSFIGIDDCIDGFELAQNLIVVSDFDITMPGTYDLTVKATNSRFDSSSIDLTITVTDSSMVNPIALDRYIVYTQAGAVIDFMSFVSEYEESEVTVNTDNVNLYAAGVYEAIYSAEGKDDTRLVIVCEEAGNK